jgi:anti-sigma B factor antagonist
VGNIDIAVRSRDEGEWRVVEVEGEIDMFSAPKLREQLLEAVDAARYRMMVDLRGVTFMDSTGLGTLVGGLKRVKEHDGTLGLICTNRAVLRVLQITGLDKVFPIHPSLEQALASA